MLVGYYDETFLSHHEWRHPERPERLVAVRRVMEESGLNAEIAWGTVRPATQEEILTVHEATVWRQVQRLRCSCPRPAPKIATSARCATI